MFSGKNFLSPKEQDKDRHSAGTGFVRYITAGRIYTCEIRVKHTKALSVRGSAFCES